MSNPLHSHNLPGTSMPDGCQNRAGTMPSAARSSVGARLAKLTLALALGLSVGWGVQHAYQSWQAHQAAQPFVPAASPWWQSFGLWGGSGSSPAVGYLSASLVIAGQTHSLDQGPISLPSGARFQLRMRSPLAGHLSVTAVNSLGESTGVPLWSGEVGQGQELLSPMLRLEGPRGRETMTMVLQPYSVGQAPLIRSVELWHL